MRLRDLVPDSTVTVTPTTPAREAVACMRAGGVVAAPVVLGGEVTGVVTVSDLDDWFVAHTAADAATGRDHADAALVEDVMVRRVLCLPADTSADVARSTMHALHAGTVVVADGDSLLGVVPYGALSPNPPD